MRMPSSTTDSENRAWATTLHVMKRDNKLHEKFVKEIEKLVKEAPLPLSEGSEPMHICEHLGMFVRKEFRLKIRATRDECYRQVVDDRRSDFVAPILTEGDLEKLAQEALEDKHVVGEVDLRNLHIFRAHITSLDYHSPCHLYLTCDPTDYAYERGKKWVKGFAEKINRNFVTLPDTGREAVYLDKLPPKAKGEVREIPEGRYPISAWLHNYLTHPHHLACLLKFRQGDKALEACVRKSTMVKELDGLDYAYVPGAHPTVYAAANFREESDCELMHVDPDCTSGMGRETVVRFDSKAFRRVLGVCSSLSTEVRGLDLTQQNVRLVCDFDELVTYLPTLFEPGVSHADHVVIEADIVLSLEFLAPYLQCEHLVRNEAFYSRSYVPDLFGEWNSERYSEIVVQPEQDSQKKKEEEIAFEGFDS